MEKLCIVKRRRIGNGNLMDSPPTNNTSVASPVLSLQLTNEQAAMVATNSHFQHLSQEKPPQMIFNLHFKSPSSVKLLTIDDVCNMLQVGKTTVKKLINSSTLPSVKIGRLRRFFMDDIVEYLTSCYKTDNPSEKAKRFHADVLITSQQQAETLPN